MFANYVSDGNWFLHIQEQEDTSLAEPSADCSSNAQPQGKRWLSTAPSQKAQSPPERLHYPDGEKKKVDNSKCWQGSNPYPRQGGSMGRWEMETDCTVTPLGGVSHPSPHRRETAPDCTA